MGVVPYKTFTFDGISSDTYGVYLTGEGVFNAPERDVEMVEVYGRNGDFALDHGRFKNITVTYKAGMFGTDESNFATKISNFRNWLCSKKGYCRLSDDYNPNEYRMAVYSAGLNVDHDFLIAGEFEITFECKPQRWLTSGETDVAVANNGTLSNPTLFDSSPLLAVKGYGNIGFNGYSFEIVNDVIGQTTIYGGGQFNYTVTASVNYNQYAEVTIQGASLNTSDTFTISGLLITYVRTTSFNNYNSIRSTSFTNAHDGNAVLNGTSSVTVNFVLDDITFTYGTASSSSISTAVIEINTGSGVYTTFTLYYRIDYDGSNTLAIMAQGAGGGYVTTAQVPAITCYSTKSTLLPVIYVDTEIGEVYGYNSGQLVSLNGNVMLGSDLPKLASGTNTFTYDNTVTELKVTPRWWKV